MKNFTYSTNSGSAVTICIFNNAWRSALHECRLYLSHSEFENSNFLLRIFIYQCCNTPLLCHDKWLGGFFSRTARRHGCVPRRIGTIEVVHMRVCHGVFRVGKAALKSIWTRFDYLSSKRKFYNIFLIFFDPDC